MIAPARIAAYTILRGVSEGRSDLPTAIDRARSTLKDARDRALAADIATGVQRWRLALDHIVTALATRPIEKLDPEVADILRLSAYQLLHLSRVPASAVVDDGVSLTRRAGKGSASGFVNALLRTISRKRHALPLPARPVDETNRDAALDYLSITLSHPRWLTSRWLDRFGLVRAEQWMLFNNRPAPLALRANTLRISAAELRTYLAGSGVRARPGQYAPDALIVEEGRPLDNPDVDAALFVVQDEASQLVALLAGERPGPRLIDTCAAPGGKATAFAAALQPGGVVVACDVRARRMNLLRRTVRISGADNIRLVQADLNHPLPFRDLFDCVVVDAPCSGLGTLRRDPDIKWRRDESDLAGLVAAERRMLRNAAAVVAPGGRLVYATCSSEPEENEHIVDAFLRDEPSFAPVDARGVHPKLCPDVIDAQGRLRTSPDQHGLEAFFGAVFERARVL